MPYYCTVPQCTSMAGKAKNVSFHQFPRDEELAKLWNSILKRGRPYTKYSKVCSLHFKPEDYTRVGKHKNQWGTLRKDAIPSQNLPSEEPAPFTRRERSTGSQVPSSPPPGSVDSEPNNQTGLHNTSVEIKEEEINDPDPLLPKDEDSSTNSIPDNDRSPESSDVDEPIQRTVQTTSPISEIEQSEKYMSVKRELITTTNKMTIMKERCAEHRRKIRALKEKIRRANKNIVKLKNHVKDLKMHKLVNDKNIVQERPVAKAKLPKRKKVKEEMSSSKLTVLHFLAPNIAYEFIRR